MIFQRIGGLSSWTMRSKQLKKRAMRPINFGFPKHTLRSLRQWGSYKAASDLGLALLSPDDSEDDCRRKLKHYIKQAEKELAVDSIVNKPKGQEFLKDIMKKALNLDWSVSSDGPFKNSNMLQFIRCRSWQCTSYGSCCSSWSCD
jgi:hypothetical protein